MQVWGAEIVFSEAAMLLLIAIAESLSYPAPDAGNGADDDKRVTEPPELNSGKREAASCRFCIRKLILALL